MITGRRIGGSTPINQCVSSNQGSFRHEDDESARAAAQLLSSTDDDKSENIEIDSTNKLIYSIRHDSLALFFRHVSIINID